MTQTKVRVQTIVKSNRTPQILAALRLAGKSNVTVGVHRGSGQYPGGPDAPTVDKVALWLEYGTSKMPARPFMYPAIKRNEGAIAKVAAKALVGVAYLHWRVEQGLAKIGSFVVRRIQDVIKSNVGPALSGSWDHPREGYLGWRHKHYPESGQRTLIASGLLLRSVEFRVHLDKWTEAKQAAAQAMHQDADPSKPAHKAKGPQAGRDEFGRYLKKSPEQKAEARSQARKQGEALKAQHRAQKAAANANPKAHAAAFAAQNRAYTRANKPS